MRYILNHVANSGNNYYTNYSKQSSADFELVKTAELQTNSFEEIILERFKPFLGLDYLQICKNLVLNPIRQKANMPMSVA